MSPAVRTVLLLCALACCSPLRAQLPLPPLPLPDLPALPGTLLQEVDKSTLRPVVSSVRARARDLLRRYPGQVERDGRGAPVVRSVILCLSPDETALQRALAQGFQVQDDRTLQPLGERMVTLLAPRGLGTARALRQLRDADPAGSYDFDHLFVESAAPVDVPPGPGAVANASSHDVAMPSDLRVGMIDGGVDARHPVFASQPPVVSGCEGHSTPGAHGTAVASLFVGSSPQFRGAAPGARLFAVDVYCAGATPGGRVRDIVVGLGELMAAQVRVVNISVVGPDNLVLAAVIRKVIARSIVVVAATGNDGPNAPPLYPAAYPGVVAVTAVDAREKVLMEACGGEHVRFAAPGADMLAAAPGGNFAIVRGTSYASPLVAGLIARRLSGADATPDAVVQQLAGTAADLGKAGRDRRYGFGVVGMELRTDPRHFAGRIASD